MLGFDLACRFGYSVPNAYKSLGGALKEIVEKRIHLELVDLAREKKRWCGNYPSQKQKQKIKAWKLKKIRDKKKLEAVDKRRRARESKFLGYKHAKPDGKFREPEQLMAYLIEHNILKKLEPASLDDFIGGDNPMRHILEEE